MKKFKSVLENTILVSLVLGFVCPIVYFYWDNIIAYDIAIPAAQAKTRVVAKKSHPIDMERESVGIPVRINIPRISVDAAIVKVVLAANGSMDVPKLPADVAWYSLGPRPGEIGNAAISGHVNWWNSPTAVFTKLNKLKPGDTITVQDDKGAVISFVVRESRKYNSAADATDVFFSNDRKAHLSLITCSGVWNKRTKQYSQRLVVFADKE